MALPNLTDIDALYALNDKLRDELAIAKANADRRARDAYDAGLQRGRTAGLLGIFLGALSGALVMGLYCLLLA